MSHDATLEKAVSAASMVLGGRRPKIAIVLGSGQAAVADELENPRSIGYGELFGVGGESVAGHPGRLSCGELQGRCVLVFAGRFHYYEGRPERVALPAHLASVLGVQMLLLCNAAGGIRRTMRPGELMLIRDHINLMWRSPLTGPTRAGELRFPDCSAAYDAGLNRAVRSSALEVGIVLHEGVYGAVLGPSYETPAEIRMLERLGADAVGMSTVPEVLAAAARQMPVAAVSCITNSAAGIRCEPLSHSEVLAAATKANSTVARLIRGALARFPPA